MLPLISNKTWIDITILTSTVTSPPTSNVSNQITHFIILNVNGTVLTQVI